MEKLTPLQMQWELNKRVALEQAVAAAHGRPQITTTEQIMEIADEFLEWLQK
jgi:hypothetical protein